MWVHNPSSSSLLGSVSPTALDAAAGGDKIVRPTKPRPGGVKFPLKKRGPTKCEVSQPFRLPREREPTLAELLADLLSNLGGS